MFSIAAAALRAVMFHPGTARQYAQVIFGMVLSGCVGEMAADGLETTSILLCKLSGTLFALAVALPKGVGV